MQSVVLYVDYENLRHSALHAFGLEVQNISPIALGEMIVSRRVNPSLLVEVRVYRGSPSFELDNERAVNQAEWVRRCARDPRFTFVTRPMRYLGGRGREKGIDVALAIDLVLHTLNRSDCVAVLVSRDTDFQPALETVIRLSAGLAMIEVAACEGLSRLHGLVRDSPWCHVLSREDFEAIRDDA